MVSTYEKYSNAILNVTGGNLKSVKEIDNLINEDMIGTTLGTFNTRMDLITETHEKDIQIIMDSLYNITTKLNMQGAYLSFINRFAGALWSHNFFSKIHAWNQGWNVQIQILYVIFKVLIKMIWLMIASEITPILIGPKNTRQRLWLRLLVGCIVVKVR